MPAPAHPRLSRRERQIMDVLYARARATAAEIQAALPDPPSNAAIRATLRILEEKGHVRHEEAGLRYVFLPVVPRDKAKRSALKHLLGTFFDGSAGQVVATLLDVAGSRLTAAELDEMARSIERAKKEGR